MEKIRPAEVLQKIKINEYINLQWKPILKTTLKTSEEFENVVKPLTVAIDSLAFLRKNTLETGGEDGENTPETSGEDNHHDDSKMFEKKLETTVFDPKHKLQINRDFLAVFQSYFLKKNSKINFDGKGATKTVETKKTAMDLKKLEK